TARDTAASAWRRGSGIGGRGSGRTDRIGRLGPRPDSRHTRYPIRSVRRGGEGGALDLGEGVEGGLGVRFLLGAAPRRREAVVVDLGGDLEALVVVGTLLVEQVVPRGAPELPLGHVLQLRLRVRGDRLPGHPLDLRLDEPQHEPLRLVPPAVQKDRRDQRLEHVGEHVRRDLAAGADALAQKQEAAQPLFPAELGARLAADDHGLDLRQVALLVVGELEVELFAGDQPQDAIAEELQSLVRCGASIRAGGVGEGGSEQFGSAESVADRVLAVVEDGPFSGGGGQFRRRHDSDYTGRNKNVSVWEAYHRAGSASTLRPWRRLVDPG